MGSDAIRLPRGKKGSVTHILLIMGLDYGAEKMKCHLQANHGMRCESPVECSLTFCWPWDEMGCNHGENTMLLTFCKSWDELWWECTPKQRCSITHPLLVMGHGFQRKKNPTSLTRCWWWVYIIKKTACHSHPVYHATGWDSLEKKYMVTDTLWDEWHKGVQQRKGTVSLTFCWSWDGMWWYFLEEKFTHFLLVME